MKLVWFVLAQAEVRLDLQIAMKTRLDGFLKPNAGEIYWTATGSTERQLTN